MNRYDKYGNSLGVETIHIANLWEIITPYWEAIQIEILKQI